jgi:hypothetical protein
MVGKTKRWLVVAVPITCIGAILQWSVILDRIREGLWGWYKFAGYGGGGELTVSGEAQIEFFVVSGALAAATLWMAEKARGTHPHTRRLARAAMWLLLAGMVVRAAVLWSPLVTWR